MEQRKLTMATGWMLSHWQQKVRDAHDSASNRESNRYRINNLRTESLSLILFIHLFFYRRCRILRGFLQGGGEFLGAVGDWYI